MNIITIMLILFVLLIIFFFGFAHGFNRGIKEGEQMGRAEELLDILRVLDVLTTEHKSN